MDEEERILRSLDKRANQAFEKKRQEALQGYHGKASGFHLTEENIKPSTRKESTPISPHTSFPSPSSVKNDPPSIQSLSIEESAREKGEASATGDLAKYMENQARDEEEFKRRREEEDRKKKEETASFGSSLQKYEEEAEKRDRELKARLEEESRRKREEIAAQSAKSQSFKEKQEAEEKEFRKRREEEERKKKETLDAIRFADEQRRQAALAKTRDEEERKKAAAAAAAVSRVIRCTTCGKELPPDQAVQVKGSPYCYRDSMAAQADSCAGCGKPILSGTILKAGKKKYHGDCLKCAKCNVSLQDGYRERQGKLCCIACSQKL